MAPPIKVYVSYSQPVEKKTKIIETLKPLCPARKITLVYDQNTLQHGDSITRFMDRLANGKHIITIFSDAYFRSVACMYELLTTWLRGDFADRTHAILDEGCQLFDNGYRLELATYWQQQHQALEATARNHNPADVPGTIEKVRRYRDIAQNIEELTTFAADRYTTTLPELRKNDYAQILDQINPVAPPFLRIVKQRIAKALENEGVKATFAAYLHQELNTVLSLLTIDPIDFDSEEIADHLILALEQGGRGCPAGQAHQNVLTRPI